MRSLMFVRCREADCDRFEDFGIRENGVIEGIAIMVKENLESELAFPKDVPYIGFVLGGPDGGHKFVCDGFVQHSISDSDEARPHSLFTGYNLPEHQAIRRYFECLERTHAIFQAVREINPMVPELGEINQDAMLAPGESLVVSGPELKKPSETKAKKNPTE